MSRENRRRAAATDVPAPRAAAPVAADTPVGRSISWLHCLAGLLAGEALLLVLSNVALGISNAAFGGDSLDGSIVGISSLLAVIGGGYLAARLAGRFELYQGIVVGVGFIIVGAVFQFLQEASIVHTALGTGSHYLVDLGPMSMGSLISGDFLALFGGSIGGLFAARRTR
jgi:hypothetical protein